MKKYAHINHKLAKLLSRKCFLTQCRRKGLFPMHIARTFKCLYETLAKNGPFINTINRTIYKFKKAVLNIEIKQTYYSIDYYKRKLITIRTSITRNTNQTKAESFFNTQEKGLNNKTQTYNRSVLKKLQTLLIRSSNVANPINTNDKAIFNATTVHIPPEINTLLSLGPKFALPIHKLEKASVFHLMADIETILTTNTNKEIQDINRCRATNIIQNFIYKHATNTQIDEPLTKFLHSSYKLTMEFFKQHDELCVLSADKGNRTAIMKKDDYHQKMLNLVNDDHTYKCLKRDPTGPAQTKNNNFVKRLVNLKLIDENTAKRLTTYNSICPRIYGQPKAHKANIPLRPVIPNITAPTYRISKYLTQNLQQSFNSKYNISSSFDFCQKINNTILPNDYVIASLDVTSLFTNIPRRLVTRNIIRMWSTIKTNINLDLFVELIEFCMEASFFQYQNKFYQQTYGTAMGSPLSPILADIVLETIIDQAVSEAPFNIPIVYKYVDDLFITYPKHLGDDLLNIFNKQEDRLQFTIEYENNGNLPYLDMMITRDNNQQLTTQWYAKPIASGRMLNYYSFHQMKHKLNTANNLIHRVITLSPNLSNEQRNAIIRKQLLLNNYPKSLINRLINCYVAKKETSNSTNSSTSAQAEMPDNNNTTSHTPNQLNNDNNNGNSRNSSSSNHLSTQYQPTYNGTNAGASFSTRHPTPRTRDTVAYQIKNINPAGASLSQQPDSPTTEAASIQPPNTFHGSNSTSPPDAQVIERTYSSLTYIPALTDQLIKMLHTSYPNLLIATKQHKTISQLHTRVKDPVNKLDKSNIIYKINCGECSASYVGKSKNMLKTRISGHKSNVNKLEQAIRDKTNTPTKLYELKQKTALMEHCIEKQHRFDFTNTQILDHSYYSHTLDFLEMCYIKTNTSSINKRVDVDGLNTAYACIIDSLANPTNRRRNISNSV